MPTEVLVVEDDEMVADVVRISLALEGYEVTHVTNAPAALTMIAESPPDLILLDVMLPEVDGWDVLKQVRSQPQAVAIPIVILTARTLPADEARGYELGAAAYLTKPFAPDELVAKVREVLQGRRTN